MTTEQPKAIPENFRDLIEQPLVASLGTTLPDGTPQVTPVWFSSDADGYLYFNSAQGRLKDKAVRKTPYVALTIVDPNNPYRYIAVRGPVVEITDQGGREHINQLSKRYNGVDTYPGPATEIRIKYKVAPEHVSTMG